MSWVDELVIDNPLRIDARRSLRRFVQAGSSINPVYGITVFAVAYVFIFYIFARFGALTMDGVAWLGLVVAGIGPVLAFSGSIAGEREKRTWDLLRVAPVTEMQILIAKFMSAAQIVFYGWLAALPYYLWPALAGEFEHQRHLHLLFQLPGDLFLSVLTAFMLSMITLLFSWMCLALTLFCSAVMRRAFQAMMLAFSILFCWTCVTPMIATLTADSHADFVMRRTLTLTLNPGGVLADTFDGAVETEADGESRVSYSGLRQSPTAMQTWVVCGFAYLVFAVAFLLLAARGARRVDQEKQRSVRANA